MVNILEILKEEHIEKFGKAPIIENLHLHDSEKLIDLIIESLANNQPYDDLKEIIEEED